MVYFPILLSSWPLKFSTKGFPCGLYFKFGAVILEPRHVLRVVGVACFVFPSMVVFWKISMSRVDNVRRRSASHMTVVLNDNALSRRGRSWVVIINSFLLTRSIMRKPEKDCICLHQPSLFNTMCDAFFSAGKSSVGKGIGNKFIFWFLLYTYFKYYLYLSRPYPALQFLLFGQI